MTADATPGSAWWLRLAVTLLILLAIGTVLVTNRWLSERFTETTRNRAELRLALYSGNVLSELQRTSVVPLLLADDPAIRDALIKGTFADTTLRLIQVQGEIGVASILLLDGDGRAVGATNRNLLGSSHRSAAYFVDAQRTKDTVFSAAAREGGGFDFTYSRVVHSDGRAIGVIVVAVDLAKHERAWSGLQDAVAVTDSTGIVLLATQPVWRGKLIGDALKPADTTSAFGRALKGAALRLLARADGGAAARAAFTAAGNMTDSTAALSALLDIGQGQAELADFEAKWQANALVMDKWFTLQIAFAPPDLAPETTARLTALPSFDFRNPNRFRSVIGAMSGNHAGFHRADGAGYRVVADWLLKLDPLNPQTAARMSTAFETWRRYDAARQAQARAQLDRILSTPGLSRDLAEMAARLRAE